jgi:pimeloyl-ACP methyl ester carboxylesterase
MADYVELLLRSIVEGPFVIVGYSLGGAIAMELALRESHDLSGIVLLATGARLRVNPLVIRLYEAACESAGELPAMPPAAFEEGVDPRLIEEAAEHRLLTPVETAAADWHACDGFDRMQMVHRIEVPALIVGGSEDVLAPPKFTEFLAGTIVENEVHMLPGAGHMMVMERVTEIASLIASFASRL